VWRAFSVVGGMSAKAAGPSDVAAGTEPHWQIPGRLWQINITQYLSPGLHQQRRARSLTLLDCFG
jgi:hypothetical protein